MYIVDWCWIIVGFSSIQPRFAAFGVVARPPGLAQFRQHEFRHCEAKSGLLKVVHRCSIIIHVNYMSVTAWSSWSSYDWVWLLTTGDDWWPSCRAQVVHQPGRSGEVLDCQPRRRAQRSVLRFPRESDRMWQSEWWEWRRINLNQFNDFNGSDWYEKCPVFSSGVEMSPFRQAFEWRVVGGPAIRKRKRKVDRANFKLQIQGNRCWAACLSDCSYDNVGFRMVGSPPCLIHRFIDFLCWSLATSYSPSIFTRRASGCSWAQLFI